MATPATQPRPEAVAHLRFARMGPRKLRRVADAVRGKSVQEALVLLRFSGVFAAAPIARLLASAVANAANNHDMNTDELYVRRITVDGGPGGRFTKRLDPRAQGRANFKRKRLAHVTIAVGEPLKKAPRRRSGASISVGRRVSAVAPERKTTRRRPARKTRTKKAVAAGAGSKE